MASTQYPSYPYPDWSGEIGAPQPGAQASATTSTTTTTTSSASAGHGGAPHTMTTTTNNTTAAAPHQGAGPAQAAAHQGGPQNAAASPGAAQSAAPGLPAVFPGNTEFTGSTGTLDLTTRQPIEVVESPTTTNEAFLGSLKSMLLRNRGSFVTATFLIGTQGTAVWEGILHDVGNDHIVIFQPGRQRYIACDLYSLKYIEFYDTQQRDDCQRLLRQSGQNSQMGYGRNNFY